MHKSAFSMDLHVTLNQRDKVVHPYSDIQMILNIL